MHCEVRLNLPMAQSTPARYLVELMIFVGHPVHARQVGGKQNFPFQVGDDCANVSFLLLSILGKLLMAYVSPIATDIFRRWFSVPIGSVFLSASSIRRTND